jgi:transcriptional regulator with XRE-family HTH domain
LGKFGLPAEAADRLVLLGQRIRLARLRRGWTVADLALRVGVTRSTLAALEQGKPGTALGTFVTAVWILGLERSLDGVAHPDADLHGRSLEAARRPRRARPAPDAPGGEYDF